MDIIDPDFAEEYIMPNKRLAELEIKCMCIERLENDVRALQSKFEVFMSHMSAPPPALIVNVPAAPAPIMPSMMHMPAPERKPLLALVNRDKNGKIESMSISSSLTQ